MSVLSDRVTAVTMPEFFPPAPEGAELIHTRTYEVRTYKTGNDRFVLRGVVCDEKPAGLYVPGDPDPLWMHHMIVDLDVTYPGFEITSVRVEFRERPHTECTEIVGDYQKLVGVSIARGFNAKVKELFGGPRGCTHIGALLSAMAPVAIQSGWSMRVGVATGGGISTGAMTDEQRRRSYAMNLNTCHVWAEDGALVTGLQEGGSIEIPLSVRRRLADLGRDESQWLFNQS